MRKTVWLFAAAGLALAVLLATTVSPFASSSPDGLEKVAQTKGFAQAAEGHQVWKWAPIAEYLMPGVRSERVATALAGLVGTLAVFGASVALAAALAKKRRSSQSHSGSREDGSR